ncbi:MAG: response regulator [Spirochaetales bacterium]|uniref:Response regulator n=1 Tax=Candidatus Thalassospirochaeta sargassi TaxID=3119039 RepID=A0AAJ1MIA8_9SPIO|nr:response regulator [Spirochaetales bacterium]
MEKTRILIADDEPVNLEFFDVTLGKLGFDVYKAEDGYETLEKVKEINPDLIILDNIMPNLSGWKVTSLLKESEEYKEYRDIPIIMLSAMDKVRDKVEGFELGVEDYITEPFNFSEVYARIRAVLRNRVLKEQVLSREKRLSTVESMNDSLKYFTRHIKEPMAELNRLSTEIDLDDKEAVHTLIARVSKESEEALAAIEGLEEEIQELEQTADNDFHGSALNDLEEKFKKRYKALKEESLNEEA